MEFRNNLTSNPGFTRTELTKNVDHDIHAGCSTWTGCGACVSTMILYICRLVYNESTCITVTITFVNNFAMRVFPFFFGLWRATCILANNFNLAVFSISYLNLAVRWVKYHNRFCRVWKWMKKVITMVTKNCSCE